MGHNRGGYSHVSDREHIFLRSGGLAVLCFWLMFSQSGDSGGLRDLCMFMLLSRTRGGQGGGERGPAMKGGYNMLIVHCLEAFTIGQMGRTTIYFYS